MKRIISITTALAVILFAVAAVKASSHAMPDMGSMTESMTGDMAMRPHMKMSPSRPVAAGDMQRANAIVAALRVTLSKYRDYRAAQADGYKQFLANVKQPRYHFTNWVNALAAESGFDPARPTSLIYAKDGDNYTLLGAMYTAPKSATAAQLDARVPLSIGHWHEHVNICWGPPGTDTRRYFGPDAQFGLLGSIATRTACDAHGGRFQPVLFNWMVHVYPFETDPAKVWHVDMPGQS